MIYTSMTMLFYRNVYQYIDIEPDVASLSLSYAPRANELRITYLSFYNSFSELRQPIAVTVPRGYCEPL